MARNFTKPRPCPSCGGYNGAYRKEKRCKGFESEGGRIYCQNVETESYISPFGVKLYLQEDVAPPSYPSPATRLGRVGDTVLEVLVSPATSDTKGNEPYSQNIPSEDDLNTGLTIGDEIVHYPERPGPWGWEAHSRKMFVVRRGGVEVARDSSQLRLRSWFLEKEGEQ